MHKLRRWLVFFIFFIVTVEAGCAHLAYHTLQATLDSFSERNEIKEVPFYSQKSHQCGPAALATVLNWAGSQITPEQIADEIYTPGKEGSLQPLLISATRYHGHLPYIIRDFKSLVQEVAADHPVVVLQNLGLSWFPKWHYAVMIGYDGEKQIVILRSGEMLRKESSLSLFYRTWERAGKWGMVVLPLNELPASADENSYIDAVVNLEKINNWEAASIAYETALKKWPKSLGALMGLGNSCYAMGDLEGAEEAFHLAVELCETCGDAFNNLANVLAKQERYDAAMDAAREAIHLGGPNKIIYHETLNEIKRLKEMDD